MTSWCNLCQSCFSVFGEVNNNSINQSRSRYRAPVEIALGIQPFRERLSEKVHASIPKGIVGGFKFTVLQRNLKE